MKRILVISMLATLSSIAQADVVKPGEFLANECGSVQFSVSGGINAIKKICLGQIYGEDTKAVSIVRSFSEEVYKVVSEKSAGTDGTLVDLESVKSGAARKALIKTEFQKTVSVKIQEGPAVREATNFSSTPVRMGQPMIHPVDPNAQTPNPSEKPMLKCDGFKMIGAGDSFVRYEIIVNRYATDLKRGIPVTVVINSKLDSNTAQPSKWSQLLEAKGRLNMGSDTTVFFDGGMLSVAIGNSGITGMRKALDGKLSLAGEEDIQISCPNESAL